jgi:cephalosporin hydroxylase
MKSNWNIDFDSQLISTGNGETTSLYSKEGFRLLSDLWLKVGWDQKYIYGFTWMGRPVIQLPDDMIRIQEIIYNLKPEIIIETGVAHGGSIIYYASLCKAIGSGRVIGVDIEIRPHNREAIETHEMVDYVTLIEADSIASETIQKVEKEVNGIKNCLVILDSNHSYSHVLEELRLYSKFVPLNSYIVATDGIQQSLMTSPRANIEYDDEVNSWKDNNPKKAAEDFVLENDDFIISDPEFEFNEGNIDYMITHWPSAYIKRIK